MTTESSHHEENSSEHETGVAPETAPSCGPECACGEPAPKGNSTVKIAVCLIVAVAVCGILIFKLASTRKSAQCTGTDGFSTSTAPENKGPATNSSSQPGGSGAPISAISDLNRVAGALNTVFVIVPGKDNAPLSKETTTLLTSVEGTLNVKGISTGIFTLQSSSPDYPAVAAKVTPPGVAVLSKGGGIGFVSGGISETKLMQAYVASTRNGGCGTGDCGPSGCPTPAGNKPAVPGK